MNDKAQGRRFARGTGAVRPKVAVEGPPDSLGKVGWIALGGFVVGIAWPRMFGVSLVPEAPVGEPAAELTASGEEPTPAVQKTEDDKQLTLRDLLEVGEPKITSCRDTEGNKAKECTPVDFDQLFHPSLLALAECPAAQGVFGTLSLGVEVDFAQKKINKLESGRATDLPQAVQQELLRCAEKQLASVSLDKVRAEQSSYTVFFKLLFKTPEIAASEAQTIVPASGRVTVEWRTALIREEPETEAHVKARLLAGTRLVVTGRMGDWYRVKYDAQGREGWVHGAALGLVSDK